MSLGLLINRWLKVYSNETLSEVEFGADLRKFPALYTPKRKERMPSPVMLGRSGKRSGSSDLWLTF